MRVDDVISRFSTLKNFVIHIQTDPTENQGQVHSEELKEAFRARFPSVPSEIFH